MELKSPSSVLPIFFAVVGLAIVAGNVLHVPLVWGFNYYVLNIPFRFGGEVVSNLIILWISLFPFIQRKQQLVLFHLLIVLIGLSVLATKLAVMVLAALAGRLYFGQLTNSIFYYPAARWASYFIAIPYLVWSLSYCGLSTRVKILLLALLGISSVAAASYIIN